MTSEKEHCYFVFQPKESHRVAYFSNGLPGAVQADKDIRAKLKRS